MGLNDQGFSGATTPFATPTANHFGIELSNTWSVGGRPNGGYLTAVLAHSAGAALREAGARHFDCVAASTTFVGTPNVGYSDIDVTILRIGGSASQVRASLRQDREIKTEALMIFGDLDTAAPRIYDDIEMVHLPDRDDCIRVTPEATERKGFTAVMMDSVDLRIDPACMDWGNEPGEGIGELRGYAEFVDGQEIDIPALLFLADLCPPATFPLGSSGFVPSLQLTTYVRSRPAPGPLALRQRAQVIESGYVDEVCELWDCDGTLVAQATQLALVRF